MSDYSITKMRGLESDYVLTQSMPEQTNEEISAKRSSFCKIASDGFCVSRLANACRIEDERLEKLVRKK